MARARTIGTPRYKLISMIYAAAIAVDINVKDIANASKNSNIKEPNTKVALSLKNSKLFLTALNPSIFSMTTIGRVNISDTCTNMAKDKKMTESRKDTGADAIV